MCIKMKLLGFILLVVIFLKAAEAAKKEPKKIIIEVPKKEAIDKGKREAALHPYFYNPPKSSNVLHFQAPSSSLHLGAGYSLGGSKIVGHSSSSDSHSFSAPKFPLFTPHSNAIGSIGSPYSSHSSSSNSYPRYTSISAVYKPSGKYSSHLNTGPQIFGSNQISQPQATIAQPSAIYGFSGPVSSSLSHFSDSKGLGTYTSPSSSFSDLLSHGSHGGLSIPSGSYGAPSFGGSHGSLLSSPFSLGGGFGGHGSSSGSNPFAGFFDTHNKPSHSYIGSSSSSSFKPSQFLGSSVASPSGSYGAPSFSSHSSSPSFSSHSSVPSGSYGVPSFSSHSSIPSGSYGVPSFSSHSSIPSGSYGVPSFSSHSSIPSGSYGVPSLSSHSSPSSSYGVPSIGGHGSSHASFPSASLSSHSLPPSHGPLSFTLSDSEKSKLLSGMPIYITANQIGGQASGFESSSHHGSHGSPSLSGSYEIPSAGHAAPSSSFSHLLGGSVAPSSSYGVPSHGSSDYSSSFNHEGPSSSYGAPTSGHSYATHEESYEGPSDGKGFSSGFSSSVSHGSSGSHGAPSFSGGHSFGGSSDLSFDNINAGKFELPSLKSPQLFSSDHGASAPSSSYLPSQSYGPPSSSYGVPHDTYGPPKSSFIINADSHDASSDNSYNTIKYSRSLPVVEKAKKGTS